MNTSHIKKYAPKARKAFIEAMSKQAAIYGITNAKIEKAEHKGDLVLIGDRPFSASVIRPRERLVTRIEQLGFDQVMEHVAYSWFNRLCAIRYMELKGFLDHGRRVLSAADGSAGVPQILEECLDIDLPGLDQDKVRELKLDGTKDEMLYRELLLAQCHALHQAMPFLFETVADESELLLPQNLTKTDSLIRDLVTSIPDEDWDHIEIIGWLYQFYISEKKDQVIGKVVKSEDIPAATQLFTPNWIVQYLVQNSVGRQWLQTYPDSPLKEKMPYFIEPAEQTVEVQSQLNEITPKVIVPESIKVLDPACGSGHILIEAYKVLKAIYEEHGYRGRDIPKLILENNVYGLDIDDRAGQLAGFALMMLAREDDRRIFTRGIRLNVLSMQESSSIDLTKLWRQLNLNGEWKGGTVQELFEEEQDLNAFTSDNRFQLLQRTLERFKQAKTFGSLVEVPHEDYQELKELLTLLTELKKTGDKMQKATVSQLYPFIHQAILLAEKYEAVVANPPYMGSKGMNTDLKVFAKKEYPRSKSDLFSIYIERCLGLGKINAELGLVTPYVWMFIKSYEKIRNRILSNHTLTSLIQLEYNAFAPACIPVCTFTLSKHHISSYVGSYIKLSEFKGHKNQAPKTLEAIANRDCGWLFDSKPDEFKKIPGKPIAYWVSDSVRKAFDQNPKLKEVAPTKQGLATGNNDRFLRLWFEVSRSKLALAREKEAGRKWFPCNKGGRFRKWFGNNLYVANWENSGEEIKNFKDASGKVRSRPQNIQYYFNEGLTWSALSSSSLSMRYSPPSNMFETKGAMCFPVKKSDLYNVLAYANSKLVNHFLLATSPTLDYHEGPVGNLPYIHHNGAEEIAKELVCIHQKDWDRHETSYGFSRNALIEGCLKRKEKKLSITFANYLSELEMEISRVRKLETDNNKYYISLYSLDKELKPEVDLSEVTLTSNPKYIYTDVVQGEGVERLNSTVISELISYSIGCSVGRYSLESEGLVYANSGNEGFCDLIAEGVYNTFPADDDGIIPLTDQEWFPDDATNRFREFVKVVWGQDQLQENLAYVAESLCLYAIKPKKSESSMDTIRRYLSTQFYKDHLKTYKKRPIYWLFSSGKQKAFECLVYLHRYNESTLARIRTEYVIPLTAKMTANANKLESDKEASDSAAETKRIERELTILHKQQSELSEFDEKLRHYADQRISLDLDDGVKVNYGKFGDLLKDVKAITGKKPEVI